MDDAAFDEMLDAAEKEGERALLAEPRAARARYDRRRRRLELELINGCTATIPIDLIEGMADASEEDIAAVEVDTFGFGLHWEKLDADFSVAGLVSGVFGTRKWMDQLRARNAGRATSPAKAAAARANGAKGGRPRTKVAAAR